MRLRLMAIVTLALTFGFGGCVRPAVREAPLPQQAATPAATDDGARPDAGAEAAAGLTNTLRWTTASEVDNFGFDVYRGDTEHGPFERLTRQPVAGAGIADVPTAYAYVDETIDPDREYFYYVESISMSGERVRFTPIMRAPAKR